MKATIELPEQLMSQVKSLAAQDKRKVSDVVADLIRIGLENRADATGSTASPESAEAWLGKWFAIADEVSTPNPAEPTARQILEQSRQRLEYN